MSKDLEIKKTNAVAVVKDDDSLLIEVEAQNMPLEYINIAKNNIKGVDGKIKVMEGSVYNSQTKEEIATENTPFEICLLNYKNYMTETVDETFTRNIPLNSKECIETIAERKYYFENEEGKKVKRQMRYTFAGVLVSQLNNDVVLPVLITFKGTCYDLGKKIIQTMTRASAYKKSPARLIFEFKSVQKTKEKENQSWYVFEGGFKREASEAEFVKTKEVFLFCKNMNKDHIVDEQETPVSEVVNTPTEQVKKPTGMQAGMDDIEF